MAKQEMIKDFVIKQTSPISIAKPKMREIPTEQPAEAKPEVTVKNTPSRPAPKTILAPVEEAVPATKKTGRPKSDVEKAKISIYVPVDVKNKIVKLQHMNMKSSINEVLMEAVNDLIDKYSL